MPPPPAEAGEHLARTGLPRWITVPLLWTVDFLAAILLVADLVVVLLAVLCRYVLNAPLEWSDDVARGLMVALSFFGAAGALARGENIGIAFFLERMKPGLRRIIEATGCALVMVTSAFIAVYALQLAAQTAGQTTGSGLPLDYSFYPIGIAGICMSIFAFDRLMLVAGYTRGRAFSPRAGWRRDATLGITSILIQCPIPRLSCWRRSWSVWSQACRSASFWRSRRSCSFGWIRACRV
ncbi:MAG: TRAP transporter small permease [Acetobacteraceae bacterium]|nr:TRAP transporter small permease [Acetobacteraceae bacterium]